MRVEIERSVFRTLRRFGRKTVADLVDVIERQGVPDGATMPTRCQYAHDQILLLGLYDPADNLLLIDHVTVDTVTDQPGDRLSLRRVHDWLDGRSALTIWREHRGIELTRCADRAGLSKGYLSSIENGNRTGTVKTLLRLAEELGVSVDDILEDAEGAA